MGVPFYGFRPGFRGPELDSWPDAQVEVVSDMIYVLGRVEEVPCNCRPCLDLKAQGQDPNVKRSRYYIQGLFDYEEQAVSACVDEFYFVGPIMRNVALPHEVTQWAGLYFPLAEVKDGPFNPNAGA